MYPSQMFFQYHLCYGGPAPGQMPCARLCRNSPRSACWPGAAAAAACRHNPTEVKSAKLGAGSSARVSRPRRGGDRRSPARSGDLRSAVWPGRSPATTPTATTPAVPSSARVVRRGSPDPAWLGPKVSGTLGRPSVGGVARSQPGHNAGVGGSVHVRAGQAGHQEAAVGRPLKMTIHRQYLLTAGDGLRLDGQCWLPDGQARAAVMLVHGLTEHSGRYRGPAEQLQRPGLRGLRRGPSGSRAVAGPALPGPPPGPVPGRSGRAGRAGTAAAAPAESVPLRS